MAGNVTPRNLDPKFKDETSETLESVEEREARESAEAKERQEREERQADETPMLVHRERYVDAAGNPNEREHRMPVSEWPAYEKEHNL